MGRERREDFDMDIGPTNRPNLPSAQPVMRPDAPAVRTAVPTQGPPASAVTAATETAPASVEISRAARTLQALSSNDAAALRRETTRDEDSEALVYRVTDQKTGEVVQQIPEEAVLRLRAYLSEQASRGEDDTGSVEKLI
jgi:flagellar protein FlaG